MDALFHQSNPDYTEPANNTQKKLVMFIAPKSLSISFSFLACLFFLIFSSSCCIIQTLCIKNETGKNIRVVSNSEVISAELYPHRKFEMCLQDVMVLSENNCIEITDTQRFVSDDSNIEKKYISFPMSETIYTIYIKSNNGKLYYDYSSNTKNKPTIKSYLRKR